jgi:hypothetical protein
LLDNADCGEGLRLKETQNFDANMCPTCSTYTCEKATTCVAPQCRAFGVACRSGSYAVTETRVDANQCPQCPVTTCKQCPECPIGLIRCAPDYVSRTTNVTDSNGCVCARQECVKASCDKSLLFCPQIAVRCEAGFVAVTTQPECGCPTTTCKQCPALRCPEPACAAGSTLVKNFDDNGCPTCSTCKSDPCPLLGCPPVANAECRSTQTRVTLSAGVSPAGCMTGCPISVCCEAPVCPQFLIQCAADEEVVTTKTTDSRGCPACAKQECVKKMPSDCASIACPLGFPYCAPPKVLKTTKPVDRNGCPGCPSYECVDVATCMSTTACPPVSKPVCPAGSNAVEVKRRVFEACDQECSTWECSQVCPQIDCAAPEDRLIQCPSGTKAVTVGVELSNGCRGCGRTTCVRDVCALKPRICAFAGTRCAEGTVAVTTTPKDADGCDLCPQTTCEKPEMVCPISGCRPAPLVCKSGYHAQTVRDFDDNGCSSCEKSVCVADSCPRVACDLSTCSGAKRVTQSFDEKGCPLCDKVECLNTACPRLLCAQVLPSCEDGYVPERVDEDDAVGDSRCPSCPTYRCVKKAECPAQLFDCAQQAKCAENEVSKTDRDANGCARGCPKCVAKCATSCEDESLARKTCLSGAPQSRIIDRATQCCTWGCVGDDAIKRDTPVNPTDSAATAVLATLAVAVAAMATML